MQEENIYGRTSLFHDYDLILCPYPVSQVLQLEDTVERQQRFICRLEEERDRYMAEGADQAHRIECLLEKFRSAETALQHT